MLAASAIKAQISVNVNIGTPPQWGPVGYTEERYYYLPDVEAYYDVQTSSFIYYETNVWVHRTYLPRRYSNYDLYNGYKVVIVNYKGNSPYDNFKGHKTKYAKGYRGPAQKTIGAKPGKGPSQKAYSGNQPAKKENKSSNGNTGYNKGKSNSQGNGGGNKKRK